MCVFVPKDIVALSCTMGPVESSPGTLMIITSITHPRFYGKKKEKKKRFFFLSKLTPSHFVCHILRKITHPSPLRSALLCNHESAQKFREMTNVLNIVRSKSHYCYYCSIPFSESDNETFMWKGEQPNFPLTKMNLRNAVVVIYSTGNPLLNMSLNTHQRPPKSLYLDPVHYMLFSFKLMTQILLHKGFYIHDVNLWEFFRSLCCESVSDFVDLKWI